MCKGDLPKDDYQCMNSPQPATREVNGSSVRNAPPKTAESTNPRSVRSRRTPNWARSRTSDDGYSRFPRGISSLIDFFLSLKIQTSLISLWRYCHFSETQVPYLFIQFFIMLSLTLSYAFVGIFSSDSNLRSFSTDFKNMGQRIFVFIIGGATRSEVNP